MKKLLAVFYSPSSPGRTAFAEPDITRGKKVPQKKAFLWQLSGIILLFGMLVAACVGPIGGIMIPDPDQDPDSTPETVPSAVTIAGIQGVTSPVEGGVPVLRITETDQYTGTVAWETADGNIHTGSFKSDTVYTAVIILAAKPGYTFTGVKLNFFTVAGADKTLFYPNTNEVRATFPLTSRVISGVTAPVTHGVPVTTITATSQFTGTVAWETSAGNHAGSFAGGTVYTAVITLTAQPGFSFTGIPDDFYTVAGAVLVTTTINSAAAATVRATFPKTTFPVTSGNISGVTAPVTRGVPVTTITPTPQFTGTVAWETSGGVPLDGNFKSDTVYTAVITLTAQPGCAFIASNSFNVAGAVSVTTIINSATAATVRAAFSKTGAFLVNSRSDLAVATSSGETQIQLTSSFYQDANNNGKFIPIFPSGSRNPTPVTITGQGRADSAPVFYVGILIANDNITLKNVRINITEHAKAAPTTWGSTEWDLSYASAVTIGRLFASDGKDWMPGNERVNKNVTLQDCDITIDLKDDTATQFTSGIYVVNAPASAPFSPNSNISITGNTVTAKGYGTRAVQALNIAVWDQSIAISNNIFESRYGTPTLATGKRYGAPASAIYIGRVYTASGDGRNIVVNNTLISDVYSFYFNAYDKPPEGSGASETTNYDEPIHPGVELLRLENFSVAGTTWATDPAASGDNHRRLFEALKANIKGSSEVVASSPGTGFAFVGAAYNNAITGPSYFEVEQYEIFYGVIKAISYYGDHIFEGGYRGPGWDYGRKLPGGSTEEGLFHYTYTEMDNDDNP
jgi:hypothetical protein